MELLVLVLIWIAFTIWTHRVAKQRGAPPDLRIVIGLLLGPIAPFLAWAMSRSSQCPSCRSDVHPMATICHKCRSSLTPSEPSGNVIPWKQIGYIVAIFVVIAIARQIYRERQFTKSDEARRVASEAAWAEMKPFMARESKCYATIPGLKTGGVSVASLREAMSIEVEDASETWVKVKASGKRPSCFVERKDVIMQAKPQ